MRAFALGAELPLGAQSFSKRAVLAAGVAACLTAPAAHAQPTPFDAAVGEVAPAGTQRYRSLGEAIAAAPAAGDAPFRIFVGAGRWREKLTVDKPNIHLIGADREASVITHDTAAGMRRADGEQWGTWGCATLIVRAPGFRAENLTIENAFDYVADLAQPQFERIGSNGA